MRALLTILFILSPAFVYLGLRLASHWSHWPILSIIFLAILIFPFRRMKPWQLFFIFASMGVLTYLLVFTLLRDLIWLATGTLYPATYVVILTTLSVMIGFVNAATGPRVRHVKVPLKGFPPELLGMKIAQISDLHVGATIRKRYVERVVKKINKLTPDIVTMTGDIGDSKVSEYREDVAPMAKIKSRYGSFFVPGNHEYYWNANEWLIVLNNLGIINLVNRGKVIEHRGKSILVAGVPDPVSRLAPELEGMLKPEASRKSDFKILLSHRPGIAHEAAQAGYQLQLSGHTHGGQFFPWTIVVKFVHKLSQGLHQVQNMWVYVNPGTGSWGPLLRLGTTPEITLLELVDGQDARSFIEPITSELSL